MKKKSLKFLLIILPIGITLVLIGFIIWITNPYKASPEALALLTSDSLYTFSKAENLEFIPKSSTQKGFIFYPGGLVEPQAYSYLCPELAKKGYTCVIVIMPLNLAVTNINAADSIIKKFPEVETWVLGGHSLGGSMAARFVQSSVQKDKVTSLLLLGSYSDIDLTSSNIQVISILGMQDEIINKQAVNDSQKNLPPGQSTLVEINGNHSQFGDYGLQNGDGIAIISKDEQHSIVIENILKLLNTY